MSIFFGFWSIERKERLRLDDRPTISAAGLLFGLREARGEPNARGRPEAQRTGGQVPAVAAKVFGLLSRLTLAKVASELFLHLAAGLFPV